MSLGERRITSYKAAKSNPSPVYHNGLCINVGREPVNLCCHCHALVALPASQDSLHRKISDLYLKIKTSSRHKDIQLSFALSVLFFPPYNILSSSFVLVQHFDIVVNYYSAGVFPLLGVS